MFARTGLHLLRQQGNATHNQALFRQMMMARYFGHMDVKLPDLGEGTKEATIKEWYVKVGDEVEEYQDLCEVFTDKLVAKIPSTATGKVTEINFGDDEIAPVGHVLLKIETEEEGEESTTQTVQAAIPEHQQESASSKPAVDKATTAPPAVRHIAKKENIDINAVPGTGKNGRVTKTDVLNYIKNGGASSASQPQQASSTADSRGFSNTMIRIAPLYGVTDKDQVKKITGMKKAMTKTMTESLTIPSFTFSESMDATNLIKLRREMKEVHPKITMLPFFMKACSLAMLEFPIVNSHIDNDLDEEGYIQRYVMKHDHNYSVAVDSKDGLTVPVIKQVQEKSILDLNNSLVDLRSKLDSNSLTAADFADGTFSVSSVGNLGGKYFVPTILRPQAAIIAIGQAHKYAKYVDDATSAEGYKFVPADAINFSISADHRVLDGATVARFGSRVRQLIENPNLMLLNMH